MVIVKVRRCKKCHAQSYPPSTFILHRKKCPNAKPKSVKTLPGGLCKGK